MRKRIKKKLHSCALCKPHKTAGDCRWTSRDLVALRDFERSRKQLLG